MHEGHYLHPQRTRAGPIDTLARKEIGRNVGKDPHDYSEQKESGRVACIHTSRIQRGACHGNSAEAKSRSLASMHFVPRNYTGNSPTFRTSKPGSFVQNKASGIPPSGLSQRREIVPERHGSPTQPASYVCCSKPHLIRDFGPPDTCFRSCPWGCGPGAANSRTKKDLNAARAPRPHGIFGLLTPDHRAAAGARFPRRQSASTTDRRR